MQTDTSQADAGGEGSDDDYEKARLGGGVPTSQSSAGWGAAGKLGALGLEGQTWCKLLVPSTGWQPAGSIHSQAKSLSLGLWIPSKWLEFMAKPGAGYIISQRIRLTKELGAKIDMILT